MAWLPTCGDDDGGGSADPELVTLFEAESGQRGAIARCIADAYADAAQACAEEELDDLRVPGAP